MTYSPQVSASMTSVREVAVAICCKSDLLVQKRSKTPSRCKAKNSLPVMLAV